MFLLSWRQPFWAAGLACLLTLSLPAAATRGIPTDPEGYTEFAADRFQAAQPDAKIRIAGPLKLVIVPPGGGDNDIDLSTPYRACLDNHRQCRKATDLFAQQMVAGFATIDAPAKREDLRVVVRPVAYVEKMREVLAGRGEPVARPLVGDLWLIGVIDQPTTFKMLDTRAIAPLSLSSDQALELGRENMLKTVRAQLKWAPKEFDTSTGFGVLARGPAQASLLAFPELWAPVAETVGGNLLVAVPSPDIVVFTDGSKPDAARLLAAGTERLLARVAKPFSDAVYRWSPDGWHPVHLDGAK